MNYVSDTQQFRAPLYTHCHRCFADVSIAQSKNFKRNITQAYNTRRWVKPARRVRVNFPECDVSSLSPSRALENGCNNSAGIATAGAETRGVNHGEEWGRTRGSCVARPRRPGEKCRLDYSRLRLEKYVARRRPDAATVAPHQAPRAATLFCMIMSGECLGNVYGYTRNPV